MGRYNYKNPEISDLLPKDIIMLEWGHTKYHPFDSHCKIFKENGYEFLVCPGTTSWGAVTGRTDNMLLNIYNAAKAAIKYSAKGLLNTEWGNAGHMQRLDTKDIISQYLVAGQIIKAGTLERYYLLNKNSLNSIEKTKLLNESLKIIDEFIPQYKKNWLKENKDGGLHRSISLFYKLKIQMQNELNILK